MEFQNKEAVNGNGFSTQTPKMWANGGLTVNEKPASTSK